jgi:hypothetical protein
MRYCILKQSDLPNHVKYIGFHMFRRSILGRAFLIGICCAVGLISVAGCGDNRAKIVRPEKPLPPPDPSKQTQMSTEPPLPSPAGQSAGETK